MKNNLPAPSVENNSFLREDNRFDPLAQADIRIFAVDDEVIRADEIGLVESLNGYKASAVLEVATAGNQGQELRAVLLRVEGADGKQYFGVQALDLDKDASHRLSDRSPIGFADKTAMVISNKKQNGSTNTFYIQPEDIWGKDASPKTDFEIEIRNNNDVAIQNNSSGVLYVRGNEKDIYGELTDINLGRLIRDGLLKNGLYDGRTPVTHEYAFTGDDNVVEVRSMPQREAIVIDWSNPSNKKIKDQYVAGAVKKVEDTAKKNGVLTLHDLYEATKSTIVERMKYDSEYIKQRARDAAAKGTTYRKVNLAVIMQEGRAVCEHQGLASAVVLADLLKIYQVEGVKVSVSTEHRYGVGAHEYMKATETNTGQVTIIDPAMNYCGPEKSDNWDYRSKTEKSNDGIWIGV